MVPEKSQENLLKLPEPLDMERTDDNFLKVAQLRTSHEIGQKIKEESNTTRNAHGTA